MEHNGSVFPDKFKYILNVASWAEAAYKRSKEGKLFPMPVHSYADILFMFFSYLMFVGQTMRQVIGCIEWSRPEIRARIAIFWEMSEKH
jgi:hypothetical protein